MQVLADIRVALPLVYHCNMRIRKSFPIRSSDGFDSTAVFGDGNTSPHMPRGGSVSLDSLFADSTTPQEGPSFFFVDARVTHGEKKGKKEPVFASGKGCTNALQSGAAAIPRRHVLSDFRNSKSDGYVFTSCVNQPEINRRWYLVLSLLQNGAPRAGYHQGPSSPALLGGCTRPLLRALSLKVRRFSGVTAVERDDGPQ